MNNTRLQSNIYKNYFFIFLNNFNVTSGVWMLYLAYRGLSLFEIGIMEAIFHITSFTMEVPTGIIADLLGRKFSRSLSTIMGVISTILMIYSTGNFGFALSFIFSALSYNLESGAGDALIYDSMKEIQQEDIYIQKKGKYEFTFQLAHALALPIGGYLATTNYTSVYIFAFVVCIVTFLQSLSFTEPSIGRVDKKANPFKTFTHQIKDSFSIIRNSKQLSLFIIMSESFGVFSTTSFFYIQNYLKLRGTTTFRIGIVLAIGSILSALTATQAHRIEKKLGSKKTLTYVLLGGIASLALIPTGIFSELGIILLGIFEVIEYVVMSDYINRLIPSERRATILSMQSMVFSFFMITLFPFVGLIGDLWGLGISFIILAILSGLVGIGILIYLPVLTRNQFVYKVSKPND